MPAENKYLIILTGPTAVGKTVLSIKLARFFNAEILSADSRQFYKELSIGTAKPSKEEMQGVPHHFIDHISIEDEYSVGKFEQEAIALLDDIFKRTNIAILTGGSGLYVNAVCHGFDEVPEASKEIRAKLNKEYREHGIALLQQKLQSADPDYFKAVDINNPQRLIRALEVCESTGIPYSRFREGKKSTRNFNIIKVGLQRERKELYERINERVDNMIAAGLVEEVRRLYRYRTLNALQTVGYRELFDFFEGKYTLEQAIDLIKQNTRNFAKRQITWFRKDEINWFHPDEEDKITAFINERICFQ